MPGNGYTSFGSSIHKTIQKFSQLVKQTATAKQNDLFGNKLGQTLVYPPIEKLYKLYEENWIDEWYETKADQEKAKKRGLRLLQNYYHKLTAEKLVPWEVEKFFKLKIGDYKFVGVMDCIYQYPDGTIGIVDYKTSQKARKKLERVDKKQLLIYQLAAQEFLNKKIKHLAYWDLEDLSAVIEFAGKPEEIAEVKKELEENIGQIVEAVRNDSFSELDRRKSHDCEFRNLEA
jgi:RecB family exonuclease